jgi:hypothetical protein
LKKLPTSLSFTREGVRVAVVHGRTATDDMTCVMLHDVDQMRCQSLLDQAGADVLVVGHTHHAGVIRVGASGLIVNPGALRSVLPSYTESTSGTFDVLTTPRSSLGSASSSGDGRALASGEKWPVPGQLLPANFEMNARKTRGDRQCHRGGDEPPRALDTSCSRL